MSLRQRSELEFEITNLYNELFSTPHCHSGCYFHVFRLTFSISKAMHFFLLFNWTVSSSVQQGRETCLGGTYWEGNFVSNVNFLSNFLGQLWLYRLFGFPLTLEPCPQISDDSTIRQQVWWELKQNCLKQQVQFPWWVKTHRKTFLPGPALGTSGSWLIKGQKAFLRRAIEPSDQSRHVQTLIGLNKSLSSWQHDNFFEEIEAWL